MEEKECRTLKIKGEGMARGQAVEVVEIPMNKIKLGRNSRLQIKNEDLSGLMQSINSTGLLEPIGVIKKGNGYEVAYGNRRYMAFSRLGLHSIPAVVHAEKAYAKIDVMNLAENVQRRQISLAEIGRYATILEGEGMNLKELAVRLGTPVNYLDSAIKAYREVPQEYRDDLQVQIVGGKSEPGKITITAAKAILNVKKAAHLPAVATKALFEAAKTDKRFNPDKVHEYVAAMKKGVKDPIGTVKPVKTLTFRFMMYEDEFDKLYDKQVTDGSFSSFTALVKAVLRGQKSVRINVLD